MASAVGAVLVKRRDDESIYVSYEEVEPPGLHEGDLLIRPTYVGICGSDLTALKGGLPDIYEVRYPHILGHEWVGIVKATRGDTPYSVGDRVLGHGDLGNDNWFGATHDGAMADLFAVPADVCFRVPEEIDTRTAAVIEPFACVRQGLNKLSKVSPGALHPGGVVHVYGLGAIGLSAVIQCSIAGMEVIGFDPSRVRSACALSMGASEVRDPLRVSETPPVPSRADVVIEASGAPAAQAMALESAASGGHVLMMGVSKPRQSAARLGLVQERDLLVLSSTGAPPKVWPETIELVRARAIDLRPLVSSVVSFADIDEALDLARNAATQIKVLTAPAGTDP